MFPSFHRSVISYLGASVLFVAGFVLIVGTNASCGDNIPPAITIGVDIGKPACVVIDGGIARADCDAGVAP
jgi:hypothetical protein